MKLIVQLHSGEKEIVVLLSVKQEVVIFLGGVTVMWVHTHTHTCVWSEKSI